MLDSYELQKREKQRIKELKEKGEYENKDGYSNFEMRMTFIPVMLLIFTVSLIFVSLVISGIVFGIK